jgi:streptogramin lyase
VNGQVWVVDLFGNRIGRLDPRTGTYDWRDVPVAEPTLPHTIATDEAGSLWLSFIGGTREAMARFEPSTGRWQIYGGFPEGLMIHDLAPGPRNVMRFDSRGFNWLTVMNRNQLVGIQKDTGEIAGPYDLTLPKGETPHHVAVYGAAMTSDGNVWAAQLGGDLIRFNTVTRKVDKVVRMPRFAGPRRLVTGDDDVLYVALYGSGQILIYDAKRMKELKRVDLPDRSSAPYAVMWDARRKVLWVGTANNSSIVRYDPRSNEFLEYPLSIDELHMRLLAMDEATGDLWIASSPSPNANPAVRYVFSLHPGD